MKTYILAHSTDGGQTLAPGFNFFAGFELKPGNVSVQLNWTKDRSKATTYTEEQLARLQRCKGHAQVKLLRSSIPVVL